MPLLAQWVRQRPWLAAGLAGAAGGIAGLAQGVAAMASTASAFALVGSRQNDNRANIPSALVFSAPSSDIQDCAIENCKTN